MVWLVIGMAIANLALGFAAALALRWRWERSSQGLAAGLPNQPSSVVGASQVVPPSGEQGDSAQAVETRQEASGGESAAIGGPDAEAPSAFPGTTSKTPSPDAGWGAAGPAQQPPQPASARSALVQAATPSPWLAPEAGDAATGAWEASVRALEESSRRYQAQLAAIDAQVRAVPPQDTQQVLAAAASLRDAGRQYLQEQKEAAPAFGGESIPPDELSALAAEVQAALEAQNAQIEASDRTLAALESASTPEEAHGSCLAESAKLRQASARVGNALESALARLQKGDELHAMPSPDEEPLPAGLIACTALEQKIAQWWQEDPERKRPLALALLELDFFEQVSGRFGRDVANRLLRAVTGIVLAEGGGHALASRSTGPAFAMAFPDADVRLAIHVVERIRQAIERSHFRCHEFDLRVTLSAGITPASPEDSLESLWQRAESALGEARRYGRNRVFVHEGRYPTPVVPPNLDLPEKSIDL